MKLVKKKGLSLYKDARPTKKKIKFRFWQYINAYNLPYISPICQCFSTAGPRPGTGPWRQLQPAASDFPGIDN